MRRPVLAVGLMLVAGLWVGAAHAQAPAVNNFPDQVIQQFTTIAVGWVGTFQGYARGTFYILAFISIAWSLAKLAMRGAVMEEIVAELANLFMFIGIGVFVLNDAPALLKSVIDSFRIAGKSASGTGISPSEILSAGLQIAAEAWGHISAWDPAASVSLIIVALVLLLCIAWIAAWMLIALVQVAIYLPVAVFFTAFLGSYWTRDIAMSVLRQSLALGAKLMMLELLAGASLQFIRNMIGVLNDFTAPNAGAVIAATFILALMVKVLPDWIAQTIGGASIGEGGAIAATGVAATAGTVAGLAAIAGTGAAAAQAGRLASEQLGASEAAGAPAQSGAARAASLVGGTAKNLASAAASDVGRRLAGSGSRHGSAPWRMADDLGNRRRLLADDMAAPRPPANSNATGNAP